MPDTIAVLDFGGQYAHLIANRVRRLGVYSEIKDAAVPAKELKGVRGIILSGGPNSVYEKGAPHCDPEIFKLGIPILGICYGHQLMQHLLGGSVRPGKIKEYGMADILIKSPKPPLSRGLKLPSPFFESVKPRTRVWMSHGDSVDTLAPGFVELAATKDSPNSAVGDPKRHFYGVQFHVEVTHTDEGSRMLGNFLDKICHARKQWDMKAFIKEEIQAIVRKVGDKKVFLLVSGGVDSAVAFALLEKALGPDRVFGVLVDTSLMRLDEASKVKASLAAAGFKNLHVADKRAYFLDHLTGITEPEKKRKIIGELFWNVKEDVAEELGLNPKEWIVAQGTIYPDTIETGGTKHADKIKTHHNRVDLMQQLIQEGKVIEPLAQLYKDEVRVLGAELGLPAALVQRQPFPGPGLGVRILCVSPEEEKNQPVFDDLNARIETFVREHFAHLGGPQDFAALQMRVLPIKSVGVQGDGRTYRHPVAIFLGKAATWRGPTWDVLESISTAITNRFPEVNRVILGVGEFVETRHVASLQIHAASITQSRADLLRRVDDIVQQVMGKRMNDFSIWQFPVVLMPIGKESIVLRPVESREAMTARFARIDWALIRTMTERIKKELGISHIFYDLTHKPPGTIEWE